MNTKEINLSIKEKILKFIKRESVNIGSLGIIISSLASLITLKEFLKHQPDKFWKYLGMFTFFNSLFLFVLLLLTNYFY